MFQNEENGGGGGGGAEDKYEAEELDPGEEEELLEPPELERVRFCFSCAAIPNHAGQRRPITALLS